MKSLSLIRTPAAGRAGGRRRRAASGAGWWTGGHGSGDEDTEGGTDTRTLPAPETSLKQQPDLPWNVLIYNDPVNLMSYVTFVIRRVFGYPEGKARKLMFEVHEQGRSVVWTGERERAEMFVEKLQSHQLLAGLERAGEP